MVVSFFPTNVVGSFSSNAIIPIILIAVTLSVAYLSLAEKEGEKVKPFATAPRRSSSSSSRSSAT